MIVDDATVVDGSRFDDEDAVAHPGVGTTIDRYVLLETLGTGGMAVVHLAYDPNLHRHVAIKLLRPSRRHAAQDHARLVREAQALAHVSHPNLVVVHDVGLWHDRVFIAMEYVRGPSLAKWLQQPRRWRAVVSVFRAAGEGLAAAHQAGLVHRDLKPANLLMGEDGRVRVADFGLARLENDDAEPANDEPSPPQELGDDHTLTRSLTESGMIMGTPAYMAPEQHAGEHVDARSDQFSFCVTLYEAVYGKRPYRGRSADELYEAKLHGPPPLPTDRLVPGWLGRVIARGLCPQPEDRFESIAELLRQLERGQTRARRWLLLAGSATSLIAVGGLGYALSDRSPAPRCGEAEEPAGWNDQRRTAVEQSFAESGVTHGRESFVRIAASLDTYAARWSEMQQEACEATYLHGEQSDELLDLRMACLGRRADELGAVVELLTRGDPDLVDRAVELVATLMPLTACADADALRAAVPPPEDPRVAARVEALYAELAEVSALIEGRKNASALDQARSLWERAQAVGYAPLEAESLLALANALSSEDPTRAEQYYRQALPIAAAGRDDRLQAKVWTDLLYVVGVSQARHDEAFSLAVGAEAALARQEQDPSLRANFEVVLGTVEWGQGLYKDAIGRYELAQQLIVERVDPEDPRLHSIANNYGVVMISLGRLDEARDQFQRSLELVERTFGLQHPYVADSLMNLGIVYTEKHETALARSYYEQALAILEGVPNQNRRRISQVTSNLMVIELHEGDLDRAHTLAQQALDGLEAVHGPEHPTLAAPIDGFGMIAMMRGELSSAARHFEQACSLLERGVGKDHPNYAMVETHLGMLRLQQGHAEDASQRLTHARDTLSEAVDAAHPAFQAVDAAWAEAQLELGYPKVALPVLERLVDRLPESLEQALARFALARALESTGQDPERVVDTARRAMDTFADKGAEYWRDRVRAWLDDRVL